MNAVRKELTKEITCRKCDKVIVLIKTSDKVQYGLYQCPNCGTGIKAVY